MRKFCPAFALLMLIASACLADENHGAEFGNFKTMVDKEQLLGYLHSNGSGGAQDTAIDSEDSYNSRGIGIGAENVSSVCSEVVEEDDDVSEVKGKPSMVKQGQDNEATTYDLEFYQGTVKLSSEQEDLLKGIAGEIQPNAEILVKIKSLGYISDEDYPLSRREALQRAIEVRKFLIENDVDPLSISVDAREDMKGKLNRVEITVMAKASSVFALDTKVQEIQTQDIPQALEEPMILDNSECKCEE